VVSLVVTQRTSTYLFLRHSELRTAGRSDDFGNIGVVEDTDPSTGKGNLGGAPVQLPERLHFIGTSGTPIASQVNIARLFKIVELESLYGESVVLLHKFDVRAAAMRMEEDYIVRERLVIVMIHDVLEIDIALSAFVLLDGVFSVRIVDHVDCMLPTIVPVNRVRQRLRTSRDEREGQPTRVAPLPANPCFPKMCFP